MQKFYVKNTSKAGVSLIAVLLFMLIATIAATATWKWITSEGRSSASRMLQREAYQSAQAGIENTRAWMTFHAQDVGALVKQYVEDENHTPINLDERLRPFQRAGQDYHVWLTGVNTEKSTYKLKILSSGEARGNTRHTEVAIFNVDGLYQVKVPQQEVHKHVNFHYSYFGGGFTSTQDTMTSAAVNGNWSGNPPVIEDLWVVTGYAELSGNDVKVGGTTCIGGTASTNNNGFSAGDLFVGEDFNGLINHVAGNAYIVGNLTHGGTGSVRIDGNLSIDRILRTAQNADNRDFIVKGNLCVGDSGMVVSQGNIDTLLVEGNVWMPRDTSLWYGSLEGVAPCKCDRYNSYGIYDRSLTNLEATNVNCPEGATKDEYHPISHHLYVVKKCEGYKLTAGSDNSGAHDKIILGSHTDSKVHMKNWHTLKEYKDHRTATTYVEKTVYIRNCTGFGGTCAPEKWGSWGFDQTYSPYSAVTGGDTIYYLSFLPSNVTDVSFGKYTDAFWETDMYGYFVNAPGGEKSENTRFTDSYHSSADSNRQPAGGYVHTAGGYYRFLNHDGVNIVGSPYCKLPGATASFHPACGVNPWFMSKGELSSDLEDRDFACSEMLVAECEEVWDKGPGCDGASYVIPDVLVTAKSKYEKYANIGCAKEIKKWTKDGFETALQSCYNENINNSTKRKNNLYNDYLVVELTDTQEAVNYVAGSQTLTGKFIIIVKDVLGAGQNGLPKVSDDSYVFMFLEQGANYIQKEAKNYFIYTLGDIGNSSGLQLNGSVYAPASSCAKARFEDSRLTFNEELVQDLTDAGVICDASDSLNCGHTPDDPIEDPEPEIEDEDVVHNMDRYFISMAPQLGISLESQSKSSERLPPIRQETGKPDLDSSFVVLPRVVYLPNDPYGSFGDYINIVPLNGSHLKKDNVSIASCAPLAGTVGALNASMTAKLYIPGESKLTQGNYKCYVEAPNYAQKVPFWVVVGESSRNVPSVSFVVPSRQMSANDAATVSVVIPPHDQDFVLNMYCPTDVPNETWTVTPLPQTNVGMGSNCAYEIPRNTTKADTIDYFNIKTTNAKTGTLTYQILQGEGYNVGEYPQMQMYIASHAKLSRIPATDVDIDDYCSKDVNKDKCPSDLSNWPDCKETSVWVKPSGTSYVEEYRNDSWIISIGGSGNTTLTPVGSKCVVIVPPGDHLKNDTLEAGNSYVLRASAKAAKHSLSIVYVGNVGANNNPVVDISVEGRPPISCRYDTVGTTCVVDVFSSEMIALSIDKALSSNEKFSYWKCSGASCPTSSAVSSQSYDAFKLTDNATTVYVHFGENDQHCFFDEFKERSLKCSELDSAKYCIDNCGTETELNSVCWSAGPTGRQYEGAKWHLVNGAIDDIVYDKLSGGVSIKSGESALVMSTTNAGRSGTLKAIVQIPRVSSSAGLSDPKIRNTGFLLRSNERGTSSLMLNIFADNQNRVMAQVCSGNSSCLSDVLSLENKTLSVHSSNMMMVMATLTRTDELTVSAYEGNYFGSPDVYTKTFDLTKLSSSNNDVDYEYVGYRLTHADFKIYGIGWISEDYAAECHDTPPIVKCSFAARTEDGVVPTGKKVEPWVGHSGWFDSRDYNCETRYYYYNGGDACGGSRGSNVKCSDGYVFDPDSAGQHGFNDDDENPVLTAKAGIHCSLIDNKDALWAADPDDKNNGESNRAHCGTFWTGKYTECVDHRTLSTDEVTLYYSGYEQTIALTDNSQSSVNMRAASLAVVMDNPENSEVEVWLSSGEDWYGGELHSSQRAVINGNRAELDVATAFASGAGGFNPENVVQVGFLNKGPGSVTIRSISSVCANAVGVLACSAKLEGKAWKIDADITNIGNVTHFKVTGNRHDKGPAHEVDESLDVTGGWVAATGVETNGDVVTFTYGGETPPAPGTYSFTVSASPNNGTVEDSKPCIVEDKVDDVECTTTIISDSVALGSESPMFKFVLDKCPPGGCGEYVIKLDDVTITNGEGACPAGPRCEIQKSGPKQNSVGTYRYTVTSKSEPPSFTCAYREFKVGTAKTPVTISGCPISVSAQDPSESVIVSPTSVDGCGTEGCSYTISDGTLNKATGSGYTGGSLNFSDADASGYKTYTLTLVNSDESSATCAINVTFVSSSSSTSAEESSSSEAESSSSSEESSSSEASSSSEESSSSATSPCIPFVNGVYGYNEHCYNSGLKNMAAGKCYTMNPDRVPGGVPQWINDVANQTWWWVETPCDGSGL